MSMVHVRMDDAIKNQATDALERMGLSLSEAVRMFLTRVAADQAIPFDIKVPNAVTKAAMQEARGMTAARFNNFAELERGLASKTAG